VNRETVKARGRSNGRGRPFHVDYSWGLHGLTIRIEDDFEFED